MSALAASWYTHLRRDLVLREHARAMLDRTKSDDSAAVLIVACGELNQRLAQDVKFLGGMAAEW